MPSKKSAATKSRSKDKEFKPIKPILKLMGRPGCSMAGELSFGGFCDLKELNYKDPVLVSKTITFSK